MERPKRSKEDLNRLAVEVARLTYEEQLPPQKVLEALRKRSEDVRSTRDVRILLDRAQDPARPLVRVTVNRVDPVTPVDDFLSDALARRTGLRRVLVGKTGDRTAGADRSSPEPAAASSRRADHELHRQLAGIAARHVWAHLRDGDTIGVAPGRGPGFAVDALGPLAQAHPRAFEGLRAVSLAGGISRLTDDDAETENVDADNNAGKLAAILDAELRLVQLPLFFAPPTEDVITKAEARYLLGEENGFRIDIAILGFGLLNEEHYLLRTGPHKTRPDTRIVKPELDDLRETLVHCPTAIIDLCHNFRVGTVSPECAEAAAKIVARLNSKSVTVRPSVLNTASEKVLVGGGRQKYPALFSLLTDPGEVRVTTLVTDEGTATELLKDLR